MLEIKEIPVFASYLNKPQSTITLNRAIILETYLNINMRIIIINMGCISSSSKKTPKQVEAKTVCSTISATPFNNTLDSTGAKPSFFFKCEEPKESEEDLSDGEDIIQAYKLLLNLGVNCHEEYKLITELTSAFWFHYLVFKNSVHGSCIPGYTLTKGLKIMLLEACVNFFPAGISITPEEKFPFFSVPSEYEHNFAIFNEFLYYTKYLNNNQEFLKGLLHVEYVLKSLKNIDICGICSDYTQALEMLSKSVEDGKSLLKSVKSICAEIKAFTKDLPAIFSEISNVQSSISDTKCSAYNLVHYIKSSISSSSSFF